MSANTQKVKDVRQQVDEVTGIMRDNIDQVLKNQENLNNLEMKTDHLKEDASQFRKQATTLKRDQWWKNMKLNLIIFAIFVVIILIIVAAVCATSGNCGKKK
eukprot:c58263_g1_i1.p1 GENE.c58263_g1_i1~~c58263_g1_i1.p1  ORF type:complete len:102 (+),score=9.39 c58263_g1_i1:61-366(+)